MRQDRVCRARAGRTVSRVTHVLVIEDDPAIRGSLVRSLSGRGHAVSSAASGLGGLEQVLNEHPDVVLLDLGLPDVDGHTVLTMLRSVSPVPVIVVTARDDDGSVVRALDSGADDYVPKPFTVDQARGADARGAAPQRTDPRRRAGHGRGPRHRPVPSGRHARRRARRPVPA